MVLIAAALLHLSAYQEDLGAVSASNLIAVLKGGAFSLFRERMGLYRDRDHHADQHLQGAIIQGDRLFCGFALLVTMAVTLAFMGWFFATNMVPASALWSLCGGLLFQNTVG